MSVTDRRPSALISLRLAGAGHANAHPAGDETQVSFTIGSVRVELVDTPDALRQVLADAAALVDAIEAGR
jgi:hypothetical protein